jgi:formylmethanofuran dehydrogenase subunit D
MTEIRLTIKKRSFPSHGRARINAKHLKVLGIQEEGHIDLVNEAAGKTVKVMAIADSMTADKEIRISEEDLKDLGRKEGDQITVRKSEDLIEKAAKTVQKATRTLTGQAEKLKETVKGKAGEVKAEAEKTAGTLKNKTTKTAGKIAKTASITAEKGKQKVGAAMISGKQKADQTAEKAAKTVKGVSKEAKKGVRR